ncbi:DNA polymerase III subunit beta [bacterium]|nr:DNA polymerase III subunit beta [bacterium]
MNIKCHRLDFSEALQEILSVIPSSSMIPMLNNVHVEIHNNQMTLQATDMEISLIEKLPCESESDVVVAIPAKLLADLVKSMKEEDLQFELEELKLSLHGEKNRFFINCYDPAEFPALTQVNGNQYHIKSQDFISLFQKVIPAVSPKGEGNIAFSSVLIETIANELRLVTTDGQRLIVAKYWETADLSSLKILVPPKALNVIHKISQKQPGEIVFTVSDREVSFAIGNKLLISRRIEGAFPDYTRVIPTSHSYQILADKSELKAALGRVYLMVKDNSKKINLKVSNQTMNILGNEQEIGSGEETVAVESQGGEFELMLDAKKLMDGIDGVEGDKVALESNGTMHPLIIKEVDSEKYTYVLVSLRPK